MPVNLFGFSVSRKKTQPEAPPSLLKSFAPPDQDDGASLIEAGGLYGQYVDKQKELKT